MPLGKRRDGRTVGPSSADRAVTARRVGAYPLRRVVVAGTHLGLRGIPEWADRDVLECGHVLTAAKDLVGRRWPSRRRCVKCAKGRAPDLSADVVAELDAQTDG